MKKLLKKKEKKRKKQKKYKKLKEKKEKGIMKKYFGMYSIKKKETGKKIKI